MSGMRTMPHCTAPHNYLLSHQQLNVLPGMNTVSLRSLGNWLVCQFKHLPAFDGTERSVVFTGVTIGCVVGNGIWTTHTMAIRSNVTVFSHLCPGLPTSLSSEGYRLACSIPSISSSLIWISEHDLARNVSATAPRSQTAWISLLLSLSYVQTPISAFRSRKVAIYALSLGCEAKFYT